MPTRRRLLLVLVSAVLAPIVIGFAFAVPVVPYSHYYQGGCHTGADGIGAICTFQYTDVGSKSISYVVVGYGGYTINGTYFFGEYGP